MEQNKEEESQKKHYDISRIKKNIFSNPFNYQKLGVPMAQTCFHRQMKSNFKRYPDQFYDLKKNYVLFCKDRDCYPSICHKNTLENFLKKI